MVKLLLVGDSEIDTFETSRRYLETTYDLQISTNSKSGRNLRTIMMAIQDSYIDQQIVWVFGLTCFLWKMESLVEEGNHINLITENTEVDLNEIPYLMTDVVNFCKARNPDVLVYLILPSIKDMYLFNRSRLIKFGKLELQEAMDRHPLFRRVAMIRQTRSVWSRMKEIKERRYFWENKNYLMANHAF